MELYKLLLLDIDGTIRDESYGIPDSLKEAVHLCQQNKCQVVICTGRSMGTIQDDVLSLKCDGYIAGGGNYIQYQDHILFQQTFDLNMTKNVVSFLKEQPVAFAIESQEKVYMNQLAKDILESMNQKKINHQNINKQFIQEKIIYENNIDLFDQQMIHKICLWSHPKIYQEVKSLLKDELELAQSDQYMDMYYYEIIPQGCHKGNAVIKLQHYLGISKEETICFGDGLNDIKMFQESGLAVAMKKSHPSLKAVSDAVCEDIFDDGIYKELKRRKVI